MRLPWRQFGSGNPVDSNALHRGWHKPGNKEEKGHFSLNGSKIKLVPKLCRQRPGTETLGQRAVSKK
jgi:hypothetical protein